MKTDIYKGSSYQGKNRIVRLDKPAYIFVCPECEYRWTADKEEGILTIRDTHNRVAHPEKITYVHFRDSFG